MFVHYNNKIINADTIEWIDVKNLVEHGYVRIYYKSDDGSREYLDGPEAIDLVMRLCPAALEGKRMKYVRHRWAIHNLIGHPLMQVLAWLGFTSLGLRVHDATVPCPKKDKQ